MYYFLHIVSISRNEPNRVSTHLWPNSGFKIHEQRYWSLNRSLNRSQIALRCGDVFHLEPKGRCAATRWPQSSAVEPFAARSTACSPLMALTASEWSLHSIQVQRSAQVIIRFMLHSFYLEFSTPRLIIENCFSCSFKAYIKLEIEVYFSELGFRAMFLCFIFLGLSLFVSQCLASYSL